MKKEDKELLLKDLSARLPYGVKCRGTFCKKDTRCKGGVKICDKDFIFDGIVFSEDNVFELDSDTVIDVSSVKIYLRPLSSMTEKEKEELKELCSIYIPTDSKNIGFEDYGILVFTHHLTDNSYSFKLNLNVIDWFLAHHFDYRKSYDLDRKEWLSMIEKGLAIKAPAGMYETQT